MSFYYFESFLGMFDQYLFFLEVIYILQTFGIVCYVFFFFLLVQINFLKFQINDSNFSFSYFFQNKKKKSHSLKEIIVIIKSHYKFRIDIT